MKLLRIAVALACLLAPSAAFAQGNPDDAAITKVVMAETDRFFARDYAGWASLFVQIPNATQAWNNADGSYTHRLGWDTISARIREFMQNNPQPDKTPMARENFQIRNYGNAAFVTFDKYLGDRATVKPIREVRVLEKQGNEWKIVCVVALMDHVKPAVR
jgi:hypothetical protein